MTLRHRIAGRPLEKEDTVSLGIEIADALDAAHGEGHRASRHRNVLHIGTKSLERIDRAFQVSFDPK